MSDQPISRRALLAGVAVTSGFLKLMPKWMIVAGIALAAIGELSWFSMIVPGLLPLVPLTRFPGFIWLILAGFMLYNNFAQRKSAVA